MRLRIPSFLAFCLLAISIAAALARDPSAASASPLLAMSAVSSGGAHTCALTTGGGVKCWGGNSFGQLGNGTTASSLSPVDVGGLGTGVAAVSAGGFHACALTTAGGVKCWGSNSFGQLGNGATVDSQTPVDVSGLASGVAAISAGKYHTCAVTTVGGLKCWGNNVDGELGDRTTTARSTPVDTCLNPACTAPITGIAAVSAGDFHTCALTTGGGAKCWGYDSYGQLGTGQICNPCTTPVDVSGLTSGVAAVSTGASHTCALTTGGGAKCWGYNSAGELGNGATANSSTPVNVSGLGSGVVSVSAGTDHSCALVSGGGVKCWGFNRYGQLGNGTTTNSSFPIDVSGLTSGVSAVSAGFDHTCALAVSGGVKCWGYNSSGQLGNGTSADSHTPVDVATRPPYPAGDVNCDGAANSIDAALVLQYSAALLPALPCQQNADVNHDGQANSLDAALILQYSAGLIQSLPI